MVQHLKMNFPRSVRDRPPVCFSPPGMSEDLVRLVADCATAQCVQLELQVLKLWCLGDLSLGLSVDLLDRFSLRRLRRLQADRSFSVWPRRLVSGFVLIIESRRFQGLPIQRLRLQIQEMPSLRWPRNFRLERTLRYSL